MSKTKASGSSKNGRDSAAQRLGPKVFDGQTVNSGAIIVRQRGTRIKPGLNVGLGRDHTIFATIEGTVFFETVSRGRKRVSVQPVE